MLLELHHRFTVSLLINYFMHSNQNLLNFHLPSPLPCSPHPSEWERCHCEKESNFRHCGEGWTDLGSFREHHLPDVLLSVAAPLENRQS